MTRASAPRPVYPGRGPRKVGRAPTLAETCRSERPRSVVQTLESVPDHSSRLRPPRVDLRLTPAVNWMRRSDWLGFSTEPLARSSILRNSGTARSQSNRTGAAGGTRTDDFPHRRSARIVPGPPRPSPSAAAPRPPIGLGSYRQCGRPSAYECWLARRHTTEEAPPVVLAIMTSSSKSGGESTRSLCKPGKSNCEDDRRDNSPSHVDAHPAHLDASVARPLRPDGTPVQLRDEASTPAIGSPRHFADIARIPVVEHRHVLCKG